MTDVTDDTFETAVLARSEEVPVVVDLWAPWCGPCRTLGPILEKVIGETEGKADLVKINVDENPRASATFQVQSIPAVYALRDRKVVDGFVGAQPEPAVREFVERILPGEEETQVAALIDAGDESSLRQALELDPDNERAIVGLAQVLADRGENEEALEVLSRIPETPETRRLAAVLRTGPAEGDGDVGARLDELLDRVRDDEEARQEFLDLLEVLGPDDARTGDYRRQLASRLY